MKGIKMLKSKNVFLCLLVGYSVAMAYQVAAKQELSFATIGTLRMRSFGLDLQAEKKEEEIKDIAQALSVRLNDDDKRRLVYQICARHEHDVEEDTNLKTLAEDLDLFYGHGQNSQDTIFNRLFEGNVRTFMGEAMAAKRVARVVADKKQLDDYQECVSQFVAHEDLFKKVDVLLSRIAKSEANMLSFWQEENPATTKLVGQLFFGKRLAFLNKKADALEFTTRLGTGLQVAKLGSNLAIGVVAMYITNKFMVGSASWKHAFKAAFDMLYNPMPNMRAIKFYCSPAGCQFGGDGFAKNIEEAEAIKKDDKARKLFIGLHGGFFFIKAMNIGVLAYDTKRFISDFIQKKDSANFLQARLMSVSEYLRAIKELHTLVKAYPCLAQALPIEQVYERIFNSKSIEMQELVQLLMTNTFVGKASFFSRTGRVLAAYTLMNNLKDEFIDCMQLIGDVDAAVAVAKLYTSFASNDRVTYSFAEYATQNKPYMQAVDFWNPLVDPRVVVTNSLRLGQEGSERNILLTGSNRGGKSTLLKATMLNALLAQTITVVPARRYVATPFACLATYLNVTDDTAAGLSLFQAQVIRAKKLVEMVDALSAEQLGFVIIDEIFTGTGSKKASSAAFKVAEHMAQSDYLCFILATHFVDELTKLEEDTHGLCKNFKVDADKDEDGNIVFRHKLEEGISTQNIANELLNDEFESIDFGPDKVAVA
jgi:hypothetical protein